MKKTVFALLMLGFLAIVGCGKDKDDNNDDYYNRYGYGNGLGGYGNYQLDANGVCRNIQTGRPEDVTYCNHSGGLGGYPGYGGIGGNQWDYNFVRGFGTGLCAPGYMPVPMYGFNNTIMCVQQSFLPYAQSNFGTPFIPGAYQGLGFQAVGCFPGMSACNCNPMGGAGFNVGMNFGSGYAGLSAGICF